MARIESDREDLMREATALRRRVEFSIRGESMTVTAGFRDDDSLSIYFGAEMVQFDSENHLRRAYMDDRLYRTQGSTLAELTRIRTAEESMLERHDLTAAELVAFLDTIAARIGSLDLALQERNIAVERSVPDDVDVLAIVSMRISAIAREPISLAPPINTRR